MDEVRCNGTEARLLDCYFKGWENEDCNSLEGAMVTCYAG